MVKLAMAKDIVGQTPIGPYLGEILVSSPLSKSYDHIFRHSFPGNTVIYRDVPAITKPLAGKFWKKNI